jgi:hypothetical protein
LRPKAALGPRGEYSCETNPIRGDAAWAEAWETGDVECGTNKPNFRGGAWGLSLDPPASPPPDRLCDNASLPGVVPATNPIRTEAM